jgi:hypothetical protein
VEIVDCMKGKEEERRLRSFGGVFSAQGGVLAKRILGKANFHARCDWEESFMARRGNCPLRIHVDCRIAFESEAIWIHRVVGITFVLPPSTKRGFASNVEPGSQLMI